MSVLSQINDAVRSTVASVLNMKAAVCQEDVNSKLALCISGRKRALMITMGTSRKAIIAKTAQILALRCFEPGKLDLRIR
jgi:hypothetical protein